MKNKKEEIEILVLTDENDNKAELEILAEIEFQGSEYVVLYPTEAKDGEPVIIMLKENNEYFFIDDQEAIDGVYELFLKQ